MGLLSRLRDWLTGWGGEAPAGEPDAGSGTADEPRLDPENVTEVRTDAGDDPVEKLREIREEDAGAQDGGSADGKAG
jgi:hypothetical protein